MEGEYEWVREYLYDVRQDEEKRTYILRETPTYMGYLDLNTRLMVHKRGKRMKSDSVMAQEFPRPSQVSHYALLLACPHFWISPTQLLSAPGTQCVLEGAGHRYCDVETFLTFCLMKPVVLVCQRRHMSSRLLQVASVQ